MRFKIISFLVAFAVGGCLPDQAKEVTTCRMEADRFFRGYNSADVNNPRSQYIVACMAAKGYDFDISPANCDSRHTLSTQPTCYVPNGWLGSIFNLFDTHKK